MQGCSLLGGRRVACGHVAPGMHLANEFAERYLTGRVPMGAGRSCVIFATHMSHRTPDSNPCEPKDSSNKTMASQVVVGCSWLGMAVCGRKPAWGWRRRNAASHVSMHYVFEEVSNCSRWVDFRSAVAQG
eukprot:5430981-Pyramimonas_sp.AAC.1